MWKNELESLHLLKHPFYQAWSAGCLPIETLKEYAAQYYQQVEAFPRYLSAAHSLCPTLQARQQLLMNLVEEEQGSDNHPKLWLDFAQALGVSEQEVRAKAQLSETKSLTDTFHRLCRSGYAEALGALYAYESQVPEIALSKQEGLKKFYGIESEKALKFFEVHMPLDVIHAQVIKDLILSLSEIEQQRAKNAAVEARKALWNFLDGMEKIRAA
jgi:pyrroloquinoline-quinone synthase